MKNNFAVLQILHAQMVFFITYEKNKYAYFLLGFNKFNYDQALNLLIELWSGYISI